MDEAVFETAGTWHCKCVAFKTRLLMEKLKSRLSLEFNFTDVYGATRSLVDYKAKSLKTEEKLSHVEIGKGI